MRSVYVYLASRDASGLVTWAWRHATSCSLQSCCCCSCACSGCADRSLKTIAIVISAWYVLKLSYCKWEPRLHVIHRTYHSLINLSFIFLAGQLVARYCLINWILDWIQLITNSGLWGPQNPCPSRSKSGYRTPGVWSTINIDLPIVEAYH
jgi:hypothetical protein